MLFANFLVLIENQCLLLTVSQEASIESSAGTEATKTCVPTQTQIRQQLGSKLTDVFLEYVGNEEKAYLGLEPALVGHDTVWVNPDARLQNKVSITPVPEPQVLHLKAFMHEAVLEVGEQYLQKLEFKHSLEIEEALRKQAREMEEQNQEKFRKNGDVGSEGKWQCKKVVATLMQHFDKCFDDLVKTTQLRMRKECQLRVKEERAEVAAYMLTQLQEEVERRDMELCNEFHDILYSELNILASRYIRQINCEREIAVELMRETVRNYEKMLSDLRIELKLSNLVDVCRAITQERKECSERIRHIENEIRSKQNDIAKYIEDLKTENCTLQKMSTERMKRLMQWRQKIRELLQEFQRFINFALKSVPAHSEFMLDMENLMLKKFPEDSFLLPEDYLLYKNCLKNKLPSDTASETAEVKKSSKERARSEISGRESLGALTPSYCSKSLNEEGAEPGLTFDYDLYKSILTRRFPSKSIPTPMKSKKAVCLWKKKLGKKPINKSSEFYQMMSLAGENEKEHLFPVDCFLQKRLKTVQKICEDDPEFATIILGCSTK